MRDRLLYQEMNRTSWLAVDLNRQFVLAGVKPKGSGIGQQFMSFGNGCRFTFSQIQLRRFKHFSRSLAPGFKKIRFRNLSPAIPVDERPARPKTPASRRGEASSTAVEFLSRRFLVRD